MFCPNCGKKVSCNSKFCGCCGANLSEIVQGQRDRVASTSEKNTKSKVYILVGIFLALLLIIGSISVKIVLCQRSDAYVYLSDGKYELLTNLKNDQAIEMDSCKWGYTKDSFLSFSPDGKYVYYYSKVNDITNTGSLCRAEYGKMKKNSPKNDEYIEILATNVRIGFTLLNNGTLLFQNEDNTLYCYINSEVIKLAKGVNWYRFDASGRVIYETGVYDEGYVLYGITSDMHNKVKLASNYYEVFYQIDDFVGAYAMEYDFDNILYYKENSDGRGTIYITGFEKSSEKLADNVIAGNFIDGKLYYTISNGNTLNLYDYVIDEYSEQDSNAKEPDLEEYAVPEYSYRVISGDDISEDDYDELYTSCSLGLFWYGENQDYCSMEEAFDYRWGNEDVSEVILKATQNFIDKYKNVEDENGLILVTDEVKQELKKINNASKDLDYKWLFLCLEKVQTGTSYDYDSYNIDMEIYNEVADRAAMRKKLQSSENAYPVCSLYCYDNGVQTLICDDVLDICKYSNLIFYNTVDMVSEKMNLEDIEVVFDIKQLFSVDLEACNYVLTAGDMKASIQMSESATETVGAALDSTYTTFYGMSSAIIMSNTVGEIGIAEISNGKVGSFTIIADDANVLEIDYSNNVIYYFDEIYKNNNYRYGDLYCYQNDKTVCLAKNVLLSTLNIYSDDIILTYTDYNSSYGYELTQFDASGKSTTIAEDVTQYMRIDNSTLLYISDDDLFCYDGKEKKMLCSNVDWIWSLNSADIVKSLGNEYDFY